MKIEKRCFLQWFMMSLACGVGAFFAWHVGIPQRIWETDMTYMTSVIAGMFVVAASYLGFASWRFDRKLSGWHYEKQLSIAHADVGIGHFGVAAVVYVGLIGTVIGLMAQLQAMSGIDPANPASGAAFLGGTIRALSTAFYATGCGLVAATLLGCFTQNLSYFVSRSEVE